VTALGLFAGVALACGLYGTAWLLALAFEWCFDVEGYLR
jgi:hypothetical protein